MKIELDINLIIYIAVMIVGVILVLLTDDTNSDFFGSSREWAWTLYIIFGVVFTFIYGGFVWW